MKYASCPALLAMAIMLSGCAMDDDWTDSTSRIDHPSDAHEVVAADQLAWRTGPDALPRGAQLAVLEGDLSEAGPVVARLRLPDGYRIPPHRHPSMERVTVLQGTVHMGMGERFDRDATEALPAGSYFAMDPTMPHYVEVEGDTIVQLNVEGPWDVYYVNPADDPRNQ